MKEIFDLSVTGRTVMNYLKSDSFYAGEPVSKPRLSQVQKNKRLEICREWSFQNNEFFNNVIFSDETKFNLKNSDGQTFVWKKLSERLEEKNIKKTVKFGGGSVMFLGLFFKVRCW
ncbi:Transposable element Tcb2 transposase [Cucumispora dikerogammari]|nr:Transposable element Tcb2 transposase [Cucumispora dikerogammari]